MPASRGGTLLKLAFSNAAASESLPDEGNKENEDVNAKTDNGNKKDGGKKEVAPNWTTPEVIAACYAVLAANRKKADQTKIKRADICVEFYKKMAGDLINKGVWVPGGKDGHPTVEDSLAWRSKYPLTGKNKGKSPLYTKYAEATKAVHNEILPLAMRLPGPDKKPASGKSWLDFLSSLKEEYWQVWSSSRVKKRGKQMPKGK